MIIHYEIKRMQDIIDNYAETIVQHASHISFCEKCEFAKTKDNLIEINEYLMYCQPCVDNNDDLFSCGKCGDCYTTIENLEEKNGERYCDQCIDNIDTDSDEESGI